MTPIKQRRGGFIEVTEAKGFNNPERTLLLDAIQIESITDIRGGSRSGCTLIVMASGAKYRVNQQLHEVHRATARSRLAIHQGQLGIDDNSDD